MEEDEGEVFPFVGGRKSAAVPAAGDGWEAVPPPSSAGENGKGWEMVSVGAASAYDGDDLSVFPPSLHEGLHPHSHPHHPISPRPRRQEPVAVLGESSSPPSLEEEEKELLQGPRQQLLDSARCLIGSGLEFIHSKLPSRRGGGCCRTGGAVWPFAALAGLVGALLYLRRRHRREKALLLFLIHEKDQKISQLLHQIAQMNEVIAARHRVSVLRRT